MSKEQFHNLLSKAISSSSIKKTSMKLGPSNGKKIRQRKTVGASWKQKG